MEQDFTAVLVADCHVREGTEKTGEFRAMLQKLSTLKPECAVIFLGDIFDLWIAHKGYEGTLHREFLDWCSIQKEKRKVVFIEGNHELYVKRIHKECFTFVSEKEYPANGCCFCHGDQFNSRDWGYTLFRFLLRNPVMCFLAKISSGFLGPLTARLVKKIFCCRGSKEHKALPEKLFERYALSLKKRGIYKVAAGHFHRSWSFKGVPSVEIRLVPAWENRGEITLFYDGGKYLDLHWKSLPEGDFGGK